LNRPARFTVADLRRAIKAAERSGPDWAVEIAPDGTIRIVRLRLPPITAPEPVEDRERVVLW
jgi:hypothetical protein